MLFRSNINSKQDHILACLSSAPSNAKIIQHVRPQQSQRRCRQSSFCTAKTAESPYVCWTIGCRRCRRRCAAAPGPIQKRRWLRTRFRCWTIGASMINMTARSFARGISRRAARVIWRLACHGRRICKVCRQHRSWSRLSMCSAILLFADCRTR